MVGKFPTLCLFPWRYLVESCMAHASATLVQLIIGCAWECCLLWPRRLYKDPLLPAIEAGKKHALQWTQGCRKPAIPKPGKRSFEVVME